MTKRLERALRHKHKWQRLTGELLMAYVLPEEAQAFGWTFLCDGCEMRRTDWFRGGWRLMEEHRFVRYRNAGRQAGMQEDEGHAIQEFKAAALSICEEA